jgi:hypothetical protein
MYIKLNEGLTSIPEVSEVFKAKTNAYSWSPIGKPTAGKSPKAEQLHRMFRQGGVEESDSQPQCCICSQPKNRPAPTTSVHLAPKMRLYSYQN